MFELYKVFNQLLKLLFFLSLATLLGCGGNESKTTQKQIKTEKDSLEIENPVFGPENSSIIETPQEKVTKTTRKVLDVLFVQARSGLNYRGTPKGNLIGKFPLNSRLDIIEYTGIKDVIIDGGDSIRGEWVGVKYNDKIVYVFDGFLSESTVQPEFEIYSIGAYYNSNRDVVGSFLSLTSIDNARQHIDDWDGNEDWKDLPNASIGKNLIELKQGYKERFLKRRRISENDTIFIYKYNTVHDSVIMFPVNSLQVIAVVNAYSIGDDNISAYDYEIGFRLDKYKLEDNSYAHIGNKNIFQTGKIVPIYWEKINSEKFPVEIDFNIYPFYGEKWFENTSLAESFYFDYGEYKLYLQNLSTNSRINHRFFVVVNSKNKKTILKKLFSSSEGVHLNQLSTKDNEGYYGVQWIGEIFRDKPPVVFGFASYPFSCPEIHFVNESEPSIGVHCDNRH